MATLIVGGVTIPIAVSGNERTRDDGVDRARAFDNTMRVTQIGTAKRSWGFDTPPIARATADTLETTLAIVTAQTCSGDVLGASISCFVEILKWHPVVVQGGHYVVLTLALHEA